MLFLGLFWIIILTLYPHIHSSPRLLWCSICWCADIDLACWVSPCSSKRVLFHSTPPYATASACDSATHACPWLTLLPHLATCSDVTSPGRLSLINPPKTAYALPSRHLTPRPARQRLSPLDIAVHNACYSYWSSMSSAGMGAAWRKALSPFFIVLSHDLEECSECRGH